MAAKYFETTFYFLAVFSTGNFGAINAECNEQQHEHYLSPGDFILGGLFDDLHATSCRKNGGHREEGFATLHKIEAMVFALNEVNKRTDVLPKTTLGFDIYDTCGEKQLAVKQALNQVMYKKECQYMEEDFCLPAATTSRLTPKASSQLLGVIGSEWSSITTTVSYHYNAFRLPIVSYFSSSDELSDFPSFLRVIPPDRFQVQAVIALIKYFRWTSVAFIYTDDSYGRHAFKRFKNETEADDFVKSYEKICISDYPVISDSMEPSDFDSIVQSILDLIDTRVVILFTLPSEANSFVDAMVRSETAVGKFQLIASDAWANQDISSMSEINGTLKFRFVDKQVPEFEKYFMEKFEMERIHRAANSMNPWLHEFVEYDLQDGFSKESGVSRVMDSVLTFAYGLDTFIRKQCPEMNAHCLEQVNLNGSRLFDEMNQLNFLGYNEHNVSFSNKEDIGRYEIVNINCNNHNSKPSICLPVPIGMWNSVDQLQINENLIIWGTDTYDDKAPSSTCTGPPEWRHQWSYGIIVVNCIGLLCAVVVTMGYICNRNHPLIHASGSGISFLILFGVVLSYILVFAYVSKPSIITCYLRRCGFMLCFTTHFAPLLVHTCTIFRRYRAARRGSRRPGFTSSSSEIFFSLVVIMIQVGITIMFLIITPPETEIQYNQNTDLQPRQLTCNLNNDELAVSIGFNVVLIILCSILAYLTKKVPKNFKESRFIGFSVYTTLVLWVLFVPSYLNAPVATWKILIISFTLIINASVTLIFLFMVKLYAIFNVPDDHMDIATGHPPQAEERSWYSDDARPARRRSRSRRSRSLFAISQNDTIHYPGRTSSFGRAIAARPTHSTGTNGKSSNSDLFPSLALVGDGHIYPSKIL